MTPREQARAIALLGRWSVLVDDLVSFRRRFKLAINFVKTSPDLTEDQIDQVLTDRAAMPASVAGFFALVADTREFLDGAPSAEAGS